VLRQVAQKMLEGLIAGGQILFELVKALRLFLGQRLLGEQFTALHADGHQPVADIPVTLLVFGLLRRQIGAAVERGGFTRVSADVLEVFFFF
jgi:hypothetical protein